MGCADRPPHVGHVPPELAEAYCPPPYEYMFGRDVGIRTFVRYPWIMFTDLVDELMGLDDADVTERFRELELRRRGEEAELAALIAVIEARGIWGHDGHLTVKGYLRANGNWSNSDVARARRNSRLMNDHPVVGDALLDGHVGVAQLDELGRASSNRRCGDEIDLVLDQLLDVAEQLPYESLRTVVKRWETLADADGAHRDAKITSERRTVSLNEMDGGLDLRASGGSALNTAMMKKVFDQFVELEFRADVAERTELHGENAPASLLPRTDAQRRFDALVKIFERAASMPTDAVGPQLVLNIVTTRERYERELADLGLIDAADGPYADPFADLLHQYCESENGISVGGHAIIRAALTGHVRRVVLDTDGVVINFGRARRLFSGGARTALKLMAQSCENVGCDVGQLSCQIDHIQEWIRDGGSTDTDNGAVKCGGHNRSKHRLGISERRDHVGKLIQFRRDGTPITPVGQRLRLDDTERDGPECSGDCDSIDQHAAEFGWTIRRRDAAA